MKKQLRKSLVVLLAVLLVFAMFTPVALAQGEATPISFSFADVDASHPNYAAIRFVYENGLMRGIGDNLFAPNLSLDRSMVATVVYRLEGEPNTTFRQIFSDIGDGQWYSLPITWAYDNGVVQGIGDGSFAPLNQITQQELAVMMYRLAVSRGYSVSVPGNVNISSQTAPWATDALRFAVHHGFIAGDTPLANATRAQTASFVHAFATHNWSGQETPPPPPPPPPAGIRLSTGSFTVGTDIPPGTYNATAISGFGNFMGDVYALGFMGLNEILTAPGASTMANFGTPTFSNLRLRAGDTIQISGNLVVELNLRQANMPAAGSTFSVGVGQFVVGTDIPAGTFNVIATAGSGNFMGEVSSLGFWGLNEILAAPGASFIGAPRYDNLRLANGDVISVMGSLRLDFVPR